MTGQVIMFNAEPPHDQHTKVPARCVSCGEEFMREYKNLHISHACPTHVINERGHQKWCSCCHQYVLCDGFSEDTTRYDKLSVFCASCLTSNYDVLRTKLVELVDKYANMIGKSFQVGFDDILGQYIRQNGKCYYTKIPMELHDGLRSISIHLLDDNDHYKIGNIALVCKAVNEYPDDAAWRFIIDATGAIHPYVRLETKIVDKLGQLPFRKRTSDAGYDVHSVEQITIDPHTSAAVDTGIIVSPPEGAYYTIEGRSSVFAAGVTPYRGIIDGTYQGPLKVILMNNSSQPYNVHEGDRIAQLVLHPIVHGDFVVVEQFTPVENGRMGSGWGSSGK